jgi:hypothetical protein
LIPGQAKRAVSPNDVSFSWQRVHEKEDWQKLAMLLKLLPGYSTCHVCYNLLAQGSNMAIPNVNGVRKHILDHFKQEHSLPQIRRSS